MIAAGELKCEPATNSKGEPSGLQCVSIGPDRPDVGDKGSCSTIEREGKVVAHSCFIPTDSKSDKAPPPKAPSPPNDAEIFQIPTIFGDIADKVSRRAEQLTKEKADRESTAAEETQAEQEAVVEAIVKGAKTFAEIDTLASMAFPFYPVMVAATVAVWANENPSAAEASNTKTSRPPVTSYAQPINNSFGSFTEGDL